MNIKLEYVSGDNESVIEELVDIDINNVYREIGKRFSFIAIPSDMTATINDGEIYPCIISYRAERRGTYMKDGVVVPSMFVTVKNDSFLTRHEDELDFSDLKECYLTCVNYESNNYKYYHMNPTSNGIEVDYGRIGVEAGEMFGKRSVAVPYHPSLYWVRYYEKLSKGYVDNSKAYLTDNKKPSKKKVKTETTESSVSEAEASLYNILFAYSKNYVHKNLVSDKVTSGQLREAKKVFKAMCTRKTVKGFNSQLLKLMQISPRRIADVSYLLANSESDFAKIIDREESLILSMEALLNKDDPVVVKNGGFKNKIEVYYATEEQKTEVMKHLSADLQKKVDTIYRVIPVEQQKRFNKYIEDNGVKTVKQLWHGSRNENWLSIIENSLSLSVGVANGRMFGDGLYFAPSSTKSFGYTSYRGTYWARGNADTAFMGLYAVAYGKPVDVHFSQRFTQNELRRRGCHSVHAHAGQALRNDEIIVFDENAVVLNYIVKFK